MTVFAPQMLARTFVRAPSSAPVLISGATGTAFDNSFHFNGAASVAFDANLSKTSASVIYAQSGGAAAAGYNQALGKDWGSGNTKTIKAFDVYGPTDTGMSGGTFTVKLQGSSDNFASSIVDLYESGSFGTSANTIFSVTSGITTTTAYRYHRINFNGNGSNGISCAQIQFYE